MTLPEMRFQQIKRLILLLAILISAKICGMAQTTPAVLKVEPPSWWAGSSVNPVRLLIRGSNLKGTRVQVIGRDFRVVGSPKGNEGGTCLFVDVAIAPRANPGPRQLRITSASGIAHAAFEILAPLG